MPSLGAVESVYQQEREISVPEGARLSVVPEKALVPQREIRNQRKIKLAPGERIALATGNLEAKELRKLSDLNAIVEIVSIQLGYNFLKDDGMAQVARLTSLEELDLNGCRDTVSDEGVRALGKLAKLRSLRVDCLSGVTPKGWAVLNALEMLEELRLSDDVRLDAENLAGIAKLPRLCHLALATGGQGLAALANCASLESLEIENAADLSSLSKFLRHPKLSRWVFDDCPAINDDALAQLATLERLETLKLNRCPNATDKGVAQLAKASLLKSLSLESLKLDGVCLAAFAESERLEQLFLWDIEGVSSNMASIASLRRLKQLVISAKQPVSCAVTRKIVSAPKLERVSLYHLEFDEAAFEELARREAVSYIRIRACTGVDSAGVRHLASLLQLKELDLSDCAKVGDRALSALVACEALESLNLRGTGITDTGLAYLRKLPKLRRLDVGGTGVSEEGVKEICRSASLRVLHLVDCPKIDGVSEWWCRRPMEEIWTGTNDAFEILRIEWREDGTFLSRRESFEPINGDGAGEPYKAPPPADPPPNDDLG
ncbi:MAG: hypothetical protein IT461_01770 [Planctomycetes bacterium]|nr:hypothetical protein [Planctomycetota bacterium]